MKLRRGFIKEANEYALEFRDELQLASHDPICPLQLAQHLEIPVLKLSELENLDASHHSFFRKKGCQVCAAALPVSASKHIIIYNDYHPPRRQKSSIAHEIGHILLGHKATQITHDDGTRKFNSSTEMEASNLGAIIQIPQAAAIHILEQAIPPTTACQIYDVSRPLLDWQLNKSGARKIMGYRQKKNAEA